MDIQAISSEILKLLKCPSNTDTQLFIYARDQAFLNCNSLRAIEQATWAE